jgi:hypothetical protein
MACDGYFEYKLDGAHKICVQSFSFDLVLYTEYGYSRLSFDRVRFIMESVQPFARFNTFDWVCLESVQYSRLLLIEYAYKAYIIDKYLIEYAY